ncbi:MAG: hypothetical protein OEU36_15510 [Gammaproteobacteria bacterium]|nr:hypothetical protein [Gammaproteobacteria bacterium]
MQRKFVCWAIRKDGLQEMSALSKASSVARSLESNSVFMVTYISISIGLKSPSVTLPFAAQSVVQRSEGP